MYLLVVGDEVDERKEVENDEEEEGTADGWSW